MASKKRQQTFMKRKRELEVQEKRTLKRERKRAAAAAKAAGETGETGETVETVETGENGETPVPPEPSEDGSSSSKLMIVDHAPISKPTTFLRRPPTRCRATPPASPHRARRRSRGISSTMRDARASR